MGVGAAIFESGGKRTEHYVPGAYSRSYNVSSPAGVSAGNHIILGKSAGGEPLKVLEFGSLSDAKQALVDGELLNAVGYAFNCSNVYTPQSVRVMRVNTGTQGTSIMKSGDTEILKLYSWDWGAHVNQLKYWLQTGSSANSKKVTVVYKDSTIEVDNIVQQALNIIYIGDGTNPTVSITSTGMTLTAEDDTDKLVISFDDYPTLDQLVTYINDSGVYNATILHSNSEASSKELDSCSGVNIAEDTVLFANLQALIDALSDITYFGKVEFIGTSRIVPSNTDGYVYFTGGSVGEYKVAQWQQALEVLETEDIQIISTPNTDSAIQSLISAHCTAMNSTENRKERTTILGGAIGESDDAAITAAKGFNSKFVSYVTDSAIANNPLTGVAEKISAAMLGVMLCAMESAMAVNMPLTNKTIKVLSFGKTRTITNMTKLIKGGVLVCNPNPDNVAELVCIRAMTTYQGNGDLISCERSMVREDLYMNRDLRSRFNGSVGNPNNGSTDAIVQTLKDAAREWAVSGYIIPSNGDNVWNIGVKINGDKVYLEFSRYLTAPTNFVFITAVNHVYTTSVAI